MTITLSKFPVNDSWAFVFHRDEEPVWKGSPIALAGYRLMFGSREAAVKAAAFRGLDVGPGGVCTVKAPSQLIGKINYASSGYSRRFKQPEWEAAR